MLSLLFLPSEVKLLSSQPQFEIISTEQTHKIVIKTKQRGTKTGWMVANYQKLFNEKVFYNFGPSLQGFVQYLHHILRAIKGGFIWQYIGTYEMLPP